MAVGDEVGRAFIEIIPEIDRFIRTLRRDLKKILAAVEKNVEATTGNMERDFNRTGTSFTTSMRNASRNVLNDATRLANARARLEAAQRRNAEKLTKAIVTEAKKQTKEAQREAEKLTQVHAREAAKQTRVLEREAARQARDRERASRAAEKEVEREVAAFERIRNKAAREALQDIKKAEAAKLREMKAANRVAQQEARRAGITIGDETINGINRGLRRGRARARRGFGQLLDVFLTGPEIRLFISKLGANILFIVGGLAAAAAQAAVQVLTPFVIALAQSFAFLPGVALGAAAAFGVLKASTAGLGDALKVAGEEDATNFNEALKKLAPSARAVARAYREMLQELRPLQQAMQQALFADVATNIALISRSIKSLKGPLVGVSSAFNEIIFDVTRFLGGLEALRAGEQILNGLKGFLEAIRPGVVAISKSLLLLAGRAGRFGEALGGALNKLLLQFSRFLDQVDLVEFFNNIKTAIQGLSPIFRTLGVVFNILNDVATAFRPVLKALGPAFKTLGDILVDLAEAFSPGLAALARALADALKALLPAAKPIGEAMGAIAKAAAPLLEALGPILANALTVLAGVIQSVLLAAEPFLRVFAEIAGGLAKQLLPVLLTLVTRAMPPLAKAAVQVFEAFSPLIPIILRMAETFISDVLPSVLLLQDALLTKLLPQLVKLAIQVAPAVIQIFKQLEPHLPSLIAGFIQIAQATTKIVIATAPLIPVLTTMIIMFLQFASTILGAVIGAISLGSLLFQDIRGAISAVVKVIRGIIKWFSDLAATIDSTVVSAIGGVIGFFEDLGTEINNARMTILRFVGTIIQRMASMAAAVRGAVNSAGAAFGRLVTAARNRVNGVISTIRRLPSRIRSAIGNAGTILRGAGRRIIQGLINGIKSMIGPLVNAINSAVSQITKRLPASPVEEGPLSGSGDPALAGAKISQMIADGIREQIGAITSAAGAAAAAVSANLGPATAFATPGVGGVSRVFAPPTQPPAVEQPRQFDEDTLVRLLIREMARTFNGMEWRFTDVDRVVSNASGRRANIFSRS